MTRVFISPNSAQAEQSNGIGRVVHAQFRYLPEYGIELVDDERKADVIACHISQRGRLQPDILHTHGLYWTGDEGSGYYLDWHHSANADIIDAARSALAITVPSEWVAMPFKRDMRISPIVIGHGIELDNWKPQENGGYILWNKNRPGDVCDPTPAWELARRGWKVTSTFAPHSYPVPSTMKLTGSIPFDAMKKLIASASIYLATTKETFGIGTLEAMACGVPVLGFDWGGTRDIVDHMVNGYLVEPGDIDALEEGIAWIKAHRRELSANAVEKASRYTWGNVMRQYAELYEQIAEQKKPVNDDVSVVITNYNYGRYIGRCIESVFDQTSAVQEIIVVDDGSTDESLSVIANHQVKLISQQNQGVAAARNNGIAAARNPYIVCLDADDEIHPAFIRALRSVIHSDRSLGIVYTGLTVMDEGEGKEYQTGFPPEFSWEAIEKVTNPPSNCIPSACMFRKSMWERAGGYIQSHAPGEDAEFWLRGLSVGYKAKRVTNEGLFRYRLHVGSASRTKEYHAIDQWHPWMRDGLLPMAAPSKKQALVRSYSDPLVSIIVPVGPGHAKYLQAAIDSVVGQTFRDWELVIVNDSGEDLPLTPYPFANVVKTEGKIGAAKARNLGIERASGKLLFFLDADDYLDPQAIEKMIEVYRQNGGRYVYTDFFSLSGSAVESVATKAYNQKEWGWQHNIGVLIAASDVRKVGGFDDFINEDWAFWIKCAVHGVCGVRLAEPLYYYRMDTGKRRDAGFTPANLETTLRQLKGAYGKYFTGAKKMDKCCGDGGTAIIEAKQRFGILPTNQNGDNMETVRMEFTGSQVGGITYTVNGKSYKGGNNPINKFIDARPGDVERLLNLGMWRIVRPQIQEVEAEVIEEKAKDLLDEVEKLHDNDDGTEAVSSWVDEKIEEAFVEPGGHESPEDAVRIGKIEVVITDGSAVYEPVIEKPAMTQKRGRKSKRASA